MCDYSEFNALLSRYFDGEAAAEDVARLEERLVADSGFADYASRWCLMHRQIGETLREDALHLLMEQYPTGAPGLPRKVFAAVRDAEAALSPSSRERAAAQSPSCPVEAPAARAWLPRLLRNAAALAAAVVVGVGGALWWLPSTAPAPPTVEKTSRGAAAGARPAAESDVAVIATITQLVSAVWKPNAQPLHHGQPLAAGARVALQSGLAKVTYECGAEVVLEGPCEFLLEGKMVGVLQSGRITADVPRRAFAFAILAPGVDFVDLGTSFGLNVSDAGHTELHVFDGEVLCNQTGGASTGADGLIHVMADNALGFSSRAATPHDIAMDEQQFSQLIALRKGVNMQPQPWSSDQLALWLAADASIATDDQRRVIAWRDIVYADNLSAEDAIQADEPARPLLIDDAINGRPAIRFDGNSDFLLTTPLQTTDDQTVLFVGQYSPGAFAPGRRWGGQILNYDGPPSRYLSDTLEPGVLQIGEPLLEEQFQPSLLTGQVFAGFIGSTTVEAGRLDAKQVGPDAPVVASYVYDYSRGRAELRVNGRSYGVTRAFAPQAITSRKIIGRHAWMENYFHGDLAELMIFNKALSPQELSGVTAYLGDKYRIAIDPDVAADEGNRR